MPLLFDSVKNCCGCGACKDICPRNAIAMVRKGGFDYPQIDPQRCVECGLCEKVCTFQREKDNQPNSIVAYACRHSVGVRMRSSSGGIFTAVSDWILNRGGVVYGAAFDSNMVLRHARAAESGLRDAMRGSKYIQSSTVGIFPQVKADLKAGIPALFVGTPCQVSALKAYLGREEENLFCIDVICHGVPSPEVWSCFVSYLEDKYKGKLVNYAFRNKEVAWRHYSPVATFADGRSVGANDHTGSFIELFRYDVCMRPSCTVCRYASGHREGDLTIGDFWGIENVLAHLDDGKGVSAILVNSEKGEALLRSVAPEVELTPCSPSDVAAKQPNLSRPSQSSNKAESFQTDINSKPFNDVLKKYTRVGMKRRLIDCIKKVLRK